MTEVSKCCPTILRLFYSKYRTCAITRISVQGVKSLGGHFACLCREFDFYEVKRKGKYFYTFNHFYSEKSSKREK